MTVAVVLIAWALCNSCVMSEAKEEPSAGKWKGTLADGTVIDKEWMITFLLDHQLAVTNWRANPQGAREDYWQPLKGATLQGMDGTSIEREVSKRLDLWKIDESEGGSLSLLDLSGANLKKASLQELDFRATDLTHVNFEGAEMSQVQFQKCRLRQANLRNAKLKQAQFWSCEGSNAEFGNANLQEARFSKGDFTDAEFVDADLERARFDNTSVKDANFETAVLEGVVWQAKGIPDLNGMMLAAGLEKLTFTEQPGALIQLRKALQEAGLREQERKVNFALQRARIDNLARGTLVVDEGFGLRPPTAAERLEVAFHRIFFDWTCRYGLDTGKPLQLVTYLILLCAIPYACVILRRPPTAPEVEPAEPKPIAETPAAPRIPNPASGIWAVPLDKRVAATPGNPVLLHVDLSRKGWLRGLLSAATFGLFFSAISAFSTGYRDLDIGRWIERIKPEESTLRPTGWVRTVAGVQALLCFYLLALWLLTYFGRPFE
jgi:uncharacterized protein YjbI with pentapeptide repeats